jgi:hypothetical protein
MSARYLLHLFVLSSLFLALLYAPAAHSQSSEPQSSDSPAVEDESGCGWPICGLLGQRIFCVEGIESSHGRFMYNPQPWGRWQEHAQGWLGFLPSTAGVWGALIGDRSSEWDAARRMILAGAGGQFWGIWSGRC